ncbi:MAG: hypothetical protein KH299_09240 [Firmicutes bacterium]|nr:hypothetical protein [Bacillota bacterium]
MAISRPRSLCRIFCPAEAQASAGFFIVERAQILQNSTENCKICAFSILSESTSQKASISHKQENTRAPKYRQNLRWAVILPPARAPPLLKFWFSQNFKGLEDCPMAAEKEFFIRVKNELIEVTQEVYLSYYRALQSETL